MSSLVASCQALVREKVDHVQHLREANGMGFFDWDFMPLLSDFPGRFMSGIEWENNGRIMG